jgi:hypothetical protein
MVLVLGSVFLDLVFIIIMIVIVIVISGIGSGSWFYDLGSRFFGLCS